MIQTKRIVLVLLELNLTIKISKKWCKQLL